MTLRLLERKAPMLQWLAQFLTAPIINGVLDAYKAKLAAANAQGAQAVEVARAALLAEIDARRRQRRHPRRAGPRPPCGGRPGGPGRGRPASGPNPPAQKANASTSADRAGGTPRSSARCSP